MSGIGKLEIATAVAALMGVGAGVAVAYHVLSGDARTDRSISLEGSEVADISLTDLGSEAEGWIAEDSRPEALEEYEDQGISFMVDNFISPREDIDAIRAEASERLGFVPEGGISEDVEARMSRNVRIDPLYSGFLTPVTLNSDKGKFMFPGIRHIDREAVCLGEEESEFSCYDWSMEGMDILISESRGVRCTILEPASDEDDYSLAKCETNLGGDWVDIATWALRSGLVFADSPEFVSIEAEAIAADVGLWAVFQPEPDDLIDDEDIPGEELPSPDEGEDV